MSESDRAGGGVIDTRRFHGQYFEILQDTGRSQTAGMTIGVVLVITPAVDATVSVSTRVPSAYVRIVTVAVDVNVRRI